MTAFQYDLLDRKTKEVWNPAAPVKELVYKYDVASQLVDSDGLTYTYDFAGRTTLEAQSLGNNTVEMNYTYRVDGRITKLQPGRQGDAVDSPIRRSALEYSYDSVGRLSAIQSSSFSSGDTYPVLTSNYNTSDQVTKLSRIGGNNNQPTVEVVTTWDYESQTAA